MRPRSYLIKQSSQSATVWPTSEVRACSENCRNVSVNLCRKGVATWHSGRPGGGGYIEAIGGRYLFCGRRSIEGVEPDPGGPSDAAVPEADPGEGCRGGREGFMYDEVLCSAYLNLGLSLNCSCFYKLRPTTFWKISAKHR